MLAVSPHPPFITETLLLIGKLTEPPHPPRIYFLLVFLSVFLFLLLFLFLFFLLRFVFLVVDFFIKELKKFLIDIIYIKYVYNLI